MENKKCKKCGEEKPIDNFGKDRTRPDGHYPYCKICSSQRQKKNYRENPFIYNKCRDEWKRKNPQRLKELARKTYKNNKEKFHARVKARRALMNGKIKSYPCEICGNTIVEMHHDDYSKPLEVRFLCKFHHVKHHFPNNTLMEVKYAQRT